MKKTQITPIIVCFGLALVLSLLDLSKITTSAGDVNIQIYPVVTLILLGLFWLWRTFKRWSTLH